MSSETKVNYRSELDDCVQITITVNGESRFISPNLNLDEIRCGFNIPKQGIAIAINNNIVPSSEWSLTPVTSGDSLSIFQPIAGG